MAARADIYQALKDVQEPIRDYLWTPKDMIEFTPAVLEVTFGDGRALFALTTIQNRPAYWIVRGCSSWRVSELTAPDDAPDFGDFADEILHEIENQFGSTGCLERNSAGTWVDGETRKFVPRSLTEFPVIDDELGCSWSRLEWPVLDGISLTPHPWAKVNILA